MLETPFSEKTDFPLPPAPVWREDDKKWSIGRTEKWIRCPCNPDPLLGSQVFHVDSHLDERKHDYLEWDVCKFRDRFLK